MDINLVKLESESKGFMKAIKYLENAGVDKIITLSMRELHKVKYSKIQSNLLNIEYLLDS